MCLPLPLPWANTITPLARSGTARVASSSAPWIGIATALAARSSVWAPFTASAPLADRVDQVPLPHPRAAGDALLLCDLIELLAVSIFQPPAGCTATLPALRRLLA